MKHKRIYILAVLFLAALWLGTALAGVFHHHDHSDPMGEHCALCLALQVLSLPVLSLVFALVVFTNSAFIASNDILPPEQCRGCIPLRSPPLSA